MRLGAISKQWIIDFGLYRPARALVDMLDLHRVRENRKRKAFYANLIRPSDLVFDIGANQGDYAAAFLALGARVVAVEPQPSCIRELQARFRDKLVVESLAVGETKGTATLYIRANKGASGLVRDWDQSIGSIDVPVDTLDSLIEKHGKPDYLKIDIEGFEIHALRGLTRIVDLISFEYHTAHLNDAFLCIERLKEMGLKQFAIIEDGGSSWSLPWTDAQSFASFFPEKCQMSFGDIFARR